MLERIKETAQFIKNIIKTIFSKQKVNLRDDRYTINITNNGFNLSDKNNIYLSVEWKNIIKIIMRMRMKTLIKLCYIQKSYMIMKIILN